MKTRNLKIILSAALPTGTATKADHGSRKSRPRKQKKQTTEAKPPEAMEKPRHHQRFWTDGSSEYFMHRTGAALVRFA